MIRIAQCLSLTALFVLPLMGCDNTAKVPQAQSAETSSSSSSSQPILIGYSDWPGWVAWQVAIDKGWLKDAGLNVEFKWFDYSASLAAFAANQLDAVLVTNGDNLVTAAGGTQGVMILATDYSAGNDVIIAKAGINSIAELKGKSVAVEQGLVDHLLLSSAMADAKLPATDIKLINSVTNELPQVFASAGIDAIAVWQPVANQALKAVSGSKIIYSSKDKPGLIYDTLSVNANHLATHPEAWKKIIQVWDKTVKYIQDPVTRDDAINIMAHRVGVDPAQYAQFVGGTHLLDLAANKQVFRKGAGLDSIYGSTYHVNQFNLRNGIYHTEVNADGLISASLIDTLP
jgi:NitT/TauT family transport system substrate-binding protein